MIETSARRGVLGRQFIDIHRERTEAILQIVDAGWKLAATFPRVHADAGEVEITEFLRDGMRAALAESATNWSRRMTVLPGTESRSTAEVPRPDGRTDVPIFFNDIREEYNEHDPHAIVECKRVAGNRAGLCREYVVEGIDRFVTGKYAQNHAVGFMAGYLLSGDAASATVRINAYLTSKGRPSEHLRSASFAAAPWARSSRHRRPDPADPIVLYHAFFCFRLAPPQVRFSRRKR